MKKRRTNKKQPIVQKEKESGCIPLSKYFSIARPQKEKINLKAVKKLRAELTKKEKEASKMLSSLLMSAPKNKKMSSPHNMNDVAEITFLLSYFNPGISGKGIRENRKKASPEDKRLAIERLLGHCINFLGTKYRMPYELELWLRDYIIKILGTINSSEEIADALGLRKDPSKEIDPRYPQIINEIDDLRIKGETRCEAMAIIADSGRYGITDKRIDQIDQEFGKEVRGQRGLQGLEKEPPMKKLDAKKFIEEWSKPEER